jgi:DNA-binding beta-propeller fold protein YncE
MRGVKSYCNGVAMSRDGSTLLVSDHSGVTRAIHEYVLANGSQRRVVGGKGHGPLDFDGPGQVCIAPDDFVFVADSWSNRVLVLTPLLDFRSFVGVGQLYYPWGVCATADIIVVSEVHAHRISVFNRGTGARLRRFGGRGSGDGQLTCPQGLCFMSGHRRVAVADWGNDRVCVFSVDGEFVRHVGVGLLKSPRGVACSPFDEIVVADTGNCRVVVLSAIGELLKSMGDGNLTGVAFHDGVVVAQDFDEACVVFM